MSSFGLGIVLNFVDNASSGMNNATNTFLNMSNTIQNASRTTNVAMQQIASGTVLNTLGTSLTNFGTGITNVFKSALDNVNTVGSEFQAFNVTLSQLYGNTEKAEEQIRNLMNFSVHSPFEVEDTKDMLVVLKSQGIEAFDSIKGSITGAEQKTLEWVSDLMAFKPDVPISRWKKALQNYIGSGQQRSLYELLDMGKIDEILGHKIGSTTEERMNDIIEIVEKKNLRGLTKAMMETPTAYLSNIADYFTMFYKAIGDAGVFDNLFEMLKSVSELLGKFDYESGRLPEVAQIFADAFNTILNPVVSLTKKLTELTGKFFDFALAHPTLAKLAIVMFSVAGAATVALGWILRLSGSILMLAGSIKLLGGIKTVMSTIGTGFSVLGGKLLALLPLGILLYQAWKNKFLGIQDHVSNFSEKLGLVWDYFKQGYFTDEQYNLAQQLGILGAIEKIAILQHYWDHFKTGFAKGWDKTFEAFFKAIETGLKRIDTVLKNLGIDSGLSKVIELLGKSFEELFGVGKENDFENLGEVFGKIAASVIILEGTLKALSITFKLFKGVGTIFKSIGTVLSWVGKVAKASQIGKVVMGVIPHIKTLLINISAIPMYFKTIAPTILGFFGKIGAVFSTTGGWFASVGSAIGGVIMTIASAIGGAITSIAAALGISVGWVVAIIAAIIAAAVALVVFWDEVCNFFTTTVPNAFKTAVSAIGQFFSNLWSSIVNNSFVQTVIGVFTAIGNFIGQVFMLAYQVIAGVIGTIVSVISAAAQIIWSIIVGVFNVIVSVIMGVVNVIVSIAQFIGAIFRTVFYAILFVVMTVWNYIKSGFQAVWGFLQPIISAIGSFFSTVFNTIASICASICSAVGSFFSSAWGVVQGVWSSITGFFSGLMSSVWGIISPILTNIQNAFNTAASYVKSAWQTVSSFFSGIFSAISGFATSAASAISGAFSSAAAAVKSVFDWISNAISKAGDFVNGIGSKIKSVIPGFATGVESFVGGLAVINEQGGELVDLPKGTRVIPHDESIKESLNEGIRLGARAMSAFNSVNSNGTPVSSATSKTSSNDNRVIFSKGSIVITTVGATQAEMEKAAEFIMKYIERRQKLRSLAVRV